MTTFVKDPDAVLDYAIDWSAWLPEGDTINTSTWTVPVGITADSDTHDGTSTTVWLSGGTSGENYELVNRVVTTGGRTDDRTIYVNIRQR